MHGPHDQTKTAIAIAETRARNRDDAARFFSEPRPVVPDRRSLLAKIGVVGGLAIGALGAMVLVLVFLSEPQTDAERFERAKRQGKLEEYYAARDADLQRAWRVGNEQTE